MGADEYYRLISRAVAALEINGFEERCSIYNRARSIQSYQLGKPPFNKADLDRERSMLEDAISRATTKRKTTEESGGAPVRPTDIGTTPMTPLPPLRSWLKRAPYRLWQV